VKITITDNWQFDVVGSWEVEVRPVERPDNEPGSEHGAGERLSLTPPDIVGVEQERYEALPEFDPQAPGWKRGQRLFRVQSQETSAKGGLEPDSVTVCTGESADDELTRGVDYELDADWSTVGRLPGSRLQPDQPVFINYRYGLSRIDSIVVAPGRELSIREGEPHICVPRPPTVARDERTLCNLWLPGRLPRLSPQHLFPILETRYPEGPAKSPAEAASYLPNASRKLRDGSPLHVLAWGDSVTDASYLEGAPEARWQNRFVERLRRAFPQSQIRLSTLAWGGHRSRSFVEEPDGSPYSYREKLLDARPDLIVSEFVNDAYLGAPELEEQYGSYLTDFRRIGAEWIALTPHYVRPDWMGLDRESDIDDAPRPYVKALRAFAARNHLPLADASKRWGRLWRQGIPYTTLLLNAINHPDERGMELFADALMEWFPNDADR